MVPNHSHLFNYILHNVWWCYWSFDDECHALTYRCHPALLVTLLKFPWDWVQYILWSLLYLISFCEYLTQTFFQVFSAFGFVHKIATFEKAAGFQVSHLCVIKESCKQLENANLWRSTYLCRHWSSSLTQRLQHQLEMPWMEEVSRGCCLCAS